MKVNKLLEKVPKIENLERSVKVIEITIMGITDNLEKLSVDHAKLQDSLEIFMFLDQIFLKITEIQTGIATFVQDLVLAKSSHVTSTLLSIPQLMKTVDNATRDCTLSHFSTRRVRVCTAHC